MLGSAADSVVKDKTKMVPARKEGNGIPELSVYWLSNKYHDIEANTEILDNAMTPAGFLFVDVRKVFDVEFIEPALIKEYRFVYRVDLVRFRKNSKIDQVVMMLYKAFRRIEKGATIVIRDEDYYFLKKTLDQLPVIGRGGVRSRVFRSRERDVVIKCFHEKARKYFERECFFFKKLEFIDGTCPVLNVDSDKTSFEMPLIDEGWKWQDRGWNLYPIRRARQVFAYMSKIHQQGIYMVDWNPGSFLFDRHTRLYVVDFEFAYEQNDIPHSYEKNADFQGGPHAVAIPGCTGVSYEGDWREILGVTYKQLNEASAAELFLTRVKHRLFIRWPKWFLKLPKPLLSSIKRHVRMKLKTYRLNQVTVLRVR